MSQRKRVQPGNRAAQTRRSTQPREAPTRHGWSWRTAAGAIVIAAIGYAVVARPFHARTPIPPPAAAAPSSISPVAAPTFNEDPKLAAIRAAANQQPNNPPAQFQLAYALFAKQRYTEAIPIMDHILETMPDGKVYDLRGAARMANAPSAAGLTQAAGDFQMAIRQYPNWFQAHEDLGKAWAALEKWPEAASELEKSIALTPGHRHDYFDLMQAYRHTGQTKKAAEAGAGFAENRKDVDRLHDLENICTYHPDNVDAFLELGRMHVKNGNYSIALACIKRASHIRPNDPRPGEALKKVEAEWKRSDQVAFGGSTSGLTP